MGWKTGVAALAFMGLSAAEAEACTCIAPDVTYSWRTNDHAMLGKAVSVQRAGAYLIYDFVVQATAKSCMSPGTRIQVATPSSSAACGDTLPLRRSLLLFGDTRVIRGQRMVFTSSCSGNMPAVDVTRDEQAYLLSRELTCSGVTQCADGSAPLSCFVQPCATSTCSDPTAICEDNYCGGCNAEWYTPADFEASCTP